MLQRIWYAITDRRILNFLAFVLLAGLLFLGAELLQLALIWAIVALAAAALLALAWWGVRRYRAHRLQAEPEPAPVETQAQADLDAVRSAMLEAVGTIRNSRLGRSTGARALYELPWYQVFDRGVLEDSEGQVVDFSNTVIILTSNLGSGAIMQACLNREKADLPAPEELDALLRPQLVRHFKPAFLGRLQVIPYYPISDEALAQVIALKLGRIGQRVAEQHHAEFCWDDALVQAVLARCTETDSGARNIDNILHGSLLPAIADVLLARMADGAAVSKVKAGVTRQGQFRITVK